MQVTGQLPVHLWSRRQVLDGLVTGQQPQPHAFIVLAKLLSAGDDAIRAAARWLQDGDTNRSDWGNSAEFRRPIDEGAGSV